MMNEKVVQVIDDFLLRKKTAKSEKLLKDVIKDIADIVKASSETKKIKEKVVKIVEAEKSNELNSLDHMSMKFKSLCELKYKNFNMTVGKKKNQKQLKILDLKKHIENKNSLLCEKYIPVNWINYVAENLGEVSIDITHIAKLTHSSAQGSNVNVKAYKSKSTKLLLSTGGAGQKLPDDFSYSDAKYAPVAEFLQLDCEGELLGKVVSDDPFVLRSFAEDNDQVLQWKRQFECVFEEHGKSSHELLKQIYFPVLADYHLLAPLASSSLAKFIYDRVWQTRQKNMPARDARNKGLYCKKDDVLFHGTAILKVTQNNHQNVSNLNGKRLGQLILFPCQSPQWKTQIKPPSRKRKTIFSFNQELSHAAKEPVKRLQNLLLAIKSESLSLNLARKKLIASLVTEIADSVFDYAAQVQNLKNLAGWSQESDLAAHQQYWLDPFRQDEVFQTARTDLDWQADIETDFARWVNQQLKHKHLTLGVDQEKHWKKLFKPLLREFSALTDATLAEHHSTGIRV